MSSSTGSSSSSSSTSSAGTGTSSGGTGLQTWITTYFQAIHDATVANCVGRSLLNPTPGTAEVSSFPEHKFAAGKLTMTSVKALVPTEISATFSLTPSALSDSNTLYMTAARASSWVGQAEDAVILLGKDWDANLGPAVTKNIDVPDSKSQEGLLTAPPTAIKTPTASGLQTSLTNAMTQLRAKNEVGPYSVVVDPLLYGLANEAITASGDTLLTRFGKQISGFQYSTALAPKTGVMFSLATDTTIDLQIPYDLTLELLNTQAGAQFRVAEQVRLRVNDPDAIVALS